MLGIIRSLRRWTWAAYGKHPVSGDFFRLGAESPAAVLFADWMEKGYPVPTEKERPMSALRFWRFWARCENRKEIACGYVRDSNDSYGRPYPLLIIGSGPVDSWEENWDLVPAACEKTWRHIEYCSARNVRDLKQLEGEIRNTPAPQSDWDEFRSAVSALELHGTTGAKDSVVSGQIRDPAGSLARLCDYELYHVEPDHCGDAVDSVATLHKMLRDRHGTAPQALFIGGSFEQSFVVCFKRRLCYGDFAALWSVPDTGAE